MSPRPEELIPETSPRTYDGSVPLKDIRRERFCQEAVALNDVKAAYELVGLKRARGNAHRLAREPLVAKRLQYLLAVAAGNAGLTAEYMLHQIKNVVEFDANEYLGEPDRYGRRPLDIASMPPERLSKLSRVADLQIEETISGRGKRARRTLHTKMRRYDPITALTLGARLQGFLRDKSSVELTGKDGDPLRMILDQIDGKTRGLPQQSETAESGSAPQNPTASAA
jgi:hypothetical protein